MSPVDQVRAELRAALREAMRARDRGLTTALRGALAALDGAEAVPAAGHDPSVGTIEDVPRASLSVEAVARALAVEVAEHQHAADLYRERGDTVTADAMQARADTVTRFLPPTEDR